VKEQRDKMKGKRQTDVKLVAEIMIPDGMIIEIINAARRCFAEIALMNGHCVAA
jgi:hypothetical protein